MCTTYAPPSNVTVLILQCVLQDQALELNRVGIFSKKRILNVPSRAVISFKFVPVVFQREAEITSIFSHCAGHPRCVGLVCSFENNVVSAEK